MPNEMRNRVPNRAQGGRAEQQEPGADLLLLLAEMQDLARLLPGLPGDRP